MATKKRKGLGTLGVDLLISSSSTTPSQTDTKDGMQIKQLAIGEIVPNKHQPRQHFSKDALEDLANSISSQGLIQPIVVRLDKSSKYELIAGERRWRAAKIAGLTRIPAIIRQIDDHNAAVFALIENIQREDLTPIEEALALQQLITHFDITHNELAETLGRSRSAITNTLRLLKLHEKVIDMLNEGTLDMGHARAFLSLDIEQQPIIAIKVINDGMTVRQTEEYIASINDTGTTNTGKPEGNKDTEESAEIKELQKQLSQTLNTKVTINHKKSGNGSMSIHYANLDVLDGILDKIR